LAEARDKRTAARKLLEDGIDPSQDKKDKERIKGEKDAQTFERLARDWHTNKLPTWHATTARDTLRRLADRHLPADRRDADRSHYP